MNTISVTVLINKWSTEHTSYMLRELIWKYIDPLKTLMDQSIIYVSINTIQKNTYALLTQTYS